MLRAADLWFGYADAPVLRGVSLDVPAGAFVGILGPNGAGKTTLLRLLAGTRQPQRGRVTLDDLPLTRFSRTTLARRMAIVPQETHLAFDYSVAEVAMMGRYPHLRTFEIEGPSDLAIVDRALAATGTLDLRDRQFATLSGGEKQRVVIAAALAQVHPTQPEQPGILLLDEPTASLDLAYQLEIATLLTQLQREQGITVVLSTHDLNLAAGLCRTLVLIRDGIVINAGATVDVLSAPNIRELYGVDADVLDHRSGRRVVVPVKRVSGSPPQ